MAEEERNRAKAELLKHEEELAKAQSEHDAMKAKLQLVICFCLKNPMML